jgi:hypothetical protein
VSDDIEETDGEDFPARRFSGGSRILRKSTKLEIGLALVLGSVLVSAIWWARGVSSQLDTVTEAISKYDPSAIAVLSYRVQQAEYRIEQLNAALAGRR